jgi:adenine-specific DNA-methyltransferase
VKKTEHNLESFTTINGRANMFALFFEKYTPLLKTGGKFVAIIPPSMNNGAYFQKLREYIISHYKIEFLTVLRKDLFLDAQQATQILILTKTSNPSSTNKYVVDFKTLLSQPDLPIIFTDNKKLLTSFWKNKTNLNSLGFTVKTGTILWNENKQNLSSTQTQNNTVLYYSKDIKNNKLSLSPLLQHKRFLTSNKPVLTTESIIVNRVIGSIHNPSLKCAYVNTNKYYVENHLNVIQATTKNVISLQEVFNRLSATDYKKYLQALTGNTQLSAKELLYLIPL